MLFEFYITSFPSYLISVIFVYRIQVVGKKQLRITIEEKGKNGFCKQKTVHQSQEQKLNQLNQLTQDRFSPEETQGAFFPKKRGNSERQMNQRQIKSIKICSLVDQKLNQLTQLTRKFGMTNELYRWNKSIKDCNLSSLWDLD